MTIKITRVELKDDSIKGYAILESAEIEVLHIPLKDTLYGMQTITISKEALNDIVDILNYSIKNY